MLGRWTVFFKEKASSAFQSHSSLDDQEKHQYWFKAPSLRRGCRSQLRLVTLNVLGLASYNKNSLLQKKTIHVGNGHYPIDFASIPRNSSPIHWKVVNLRKSGTMLGIRQDNEVRRHVCTSMQMTNRPMVARDTHRINSSAHYNTLRTCLASRW